MVPVPMAPAAGCDMDVHWHCLTDWVCAHGHCKQSRAQLGATAVQESLAVGPGLGGMFVQAHSFSIVIRRKLSLLSSNACFPERWSGGDKGTWQGCVTAAYSEYVSSLPLSSTECKQHSGCFWGTLYRWRNSGLWSKCQLGVRAGL